MDSGQKIDDHENPQEATHDLESSLGTWTVVSDTKSNLTLTSVPKKNIDDNDDKIEILNQLEIPETRCHENEAIDDLSDGISIISESESAGESAGRFLPNLILTQQPMASLEFKYSADELINKMQSSMDNFFDPALLSNNLSRTRESFSQTSNRQLLVPQTENDQLETNVNDEQQTSLERHIPILRSGLRYNWAILCAILAIIAFIAKIKYPEWELLGINSQIEPLTERVLNLELQNNLLRAEIDIIAKQVNYLNSQEQRQQSKKGNNYKNEEKWQYKQKYEDGENDATSRIKNKNNPNQNNREPSEYQKKHSKKDFKNPTIKVWAGVGNNLEEHIRIPYDDLKNPYTCNKNEEDIAGFCVSTSKESIPDDVASTVHKHNADTINVVFEEEPSTKEGHVVDEVPPVKEDPTSTSENTEANNLAQETEWSARSKYQRTDNQNNNDVTEEMKSTKNQNKKFNKNNNIKNNSESEDEDNSKEERHRKGKHFDPERKTEDSKSRKFKEDKENNYKPRKFDGEKNKKHNSYEEEDSNKKFDKFKNKDGKWNNDNRIENSDWHEKMMKHRESSRKIKIDVDQENWYMKRANSRKEARVDDNNNKNYNKNNYNGQNNNSGKHKNNRQE